MVRAAAAKRRLFSQAAREKLVSKKLSAYTKWQNFRGGKIFRTPLRKAGREECRNGPVTSYGQGGTERSHAPGPRSGPDALTRGETGEIMS